MDTTKVAKNLSNKYSQRLIDRAKKSTADAIKTSSKSAIQKPAQATGDLIGNKITHKMTSSYYKIIDRYLYCQSAVKFCRGYSIT